MMNRRGWSPMLVMSFAVLVVAASEVIRGTDAGLSRFSVDGGGAMRCVGGVFEVSGTIGQPDAGVMTGEGFSVLGGFWFGQVAADCNTDGAIDLFDYASFEACISGPGGGWVEPSCVCFDLDADGDVDLLDWGLFQLSYGG